MPISKDTGLHQPIHQYHMKCPSFLKLFAFGRRHYEPLYESSVELHTDMVTDHSGHILSSISHAIANRIFGMILYLFLIPC